MSEPIDEFSFLSAQAAEIGMDGPPPPGVRVSIRMPDSRTVSALRYGDDEPEVTFLHGAGLNAHTWDPTILALRSPALAIDLPGHGDSSWREDADYDAQTLAPDVASVIESCTSAPQVLVGQSLGGLTAAAVAAARPDVVSGLVIVDIAPGIDTTGGPAALVEFFSGPTDWATREELEQRARAFGLGGDPSALRRGVFHNSRIRADGRVEWKHHFAHLAAHVLAPEDNTERPEAERSDAEGSGETRSRAERGWADLAAVAVPVLLLRGERGYLTDADEATFRAHLPQASVVVVDSGHNVQEEIPRDLAEILRTFSGNNPGRRRVYP